MADNVAHIVVVTNPEGNGYTWKQKYAENSREVTSANLPKAMQRKLFPPNAANLITILRGCAPRYHVSMR